jgi:hypothetical protein
VRLHPFTQALYEKEDLAFTEFSFTGTKPQPGFRAYYRGSETTWRVAYDGTPYELRGNVNALGLGVGGRLVFMSGSTNYIDFHVYTGPTIRFIGGDVTLPQKAQIASTEAIIQWMPLETALGSNQKHYWGFDVAAISLRIRALTIGFNVSYFPKDVAGLSSIQYIAALQLRDGPSIPVDLPKEEKEEN